MSTIAILPALIALAAVLYAAWVDVFRFEIPDTVSIVILALAPIHAVLHPAGYVWWSHLAAPVLMFAFGLLAFSRGWLGGGDIKLLTALAAWTGLAQLPVLFLATSLAGGVLTAGLYLARRGISLGGSAQAARPEVLRRDGAIPYAVAIAFGVLWWAWSTHGGPLAPLF